MLLLDRTRPRTLIEIGSFAGGSAIWFADQASGKHGCCPQYGCRAPFSSRLMLLIDLVRELGNCRRRIEDANLERVHALLASAEKLQCPTLTIVGPSTTEAICRLDSSNIRSQAQLLPLPEPGQLLGPLLDIQAESQSAIDQSGVGPTVRARSHSVDEYHRLRVDARRSIVS